MAGNVVRMGYSIQVALLTCCEGTGESKSLCAIYVSPGI